MNANQQHCRSVKPQNKPKAKGIDILGVPIDLGVRELGLKLGPDAFREARLVE
jgi:hypothetical protein